jgi:hypothetical protein
MLQIATLSFFDDQVLLGEVARAAEKFVDAYRRKQAVHQRDQAADAAEERTRRRPRQ